MADFVDYESFEVSTTNSELKRKDVYRWIMNNISTKTSTKEEIQPIIMDKKAKKTSPQETWKYQKVKGEVSPDYNIVFIHFTDGTRMAVPTIKCKNVLSLFTDDTGTLILINRDAVIGNSGNADWSYLIVRNNNSLKVVGAGGYYRYTTDKQFKELDIVPLNDILQEKSKYTFDDVFCNNKLFNEWLQLAISKNKLSISEVYLHIKYVVSESFTTQFRRDNDYYKHLITSLDRKRDYQEVLKTLTYKGGERIADGAYSVIVGLKGHSIHIECSQDEFNALGGNIHIGIPLDRIVDHYFKNVKDSEKPFYDFIMTSPLFD
jgi:hypothetical protein